MLVCLAAEPGTGCSGRLGGEGAGGDRLVVVRAHAVDADGAALGRHSNAVAFARQDAARCARAGHLAAVADLHLVALPGGPGTRLRVGAADQVVDLVDRLIPLEIGRASCRERVW